MSPAIISVMPKSPSARANASMPPASSPGAASGMLAFARALGDFGITLMIAGDMPGQTQTASLYIYDQVQAGRDSRAALMSAILVVVAVAILYAVNRLTRRRGG